MTASFGQASPAANGRRLAGALLGLSVILGAAGCAGDSPTPRRLDTPSATAEPTEASTPTPSPSPTGPTRASAKAFTAELIDAINVATTTGDATRLDEMSTDACVTCRAIARNTKRLYAAGGRIETSGVELTATGFTPLQPKRRPILDLDTYFHDETVHEPGKPPKTKTGHRQPLTLYLEWTSMGWRATRLDMVL